MSTSDKTTQDRIRDAKAALASTTKKISQSSAGSSNGKQRAASGGDGKRSVIDRDVATPAEAETAGGGTSLSTETTSPGGHSAEPARPPTVQSIPEALEFSESEAEEEEEEQEAPRGQTGQASLDLGQPGPAIISRQPSLPYERTPTPRRSPLTEPVRTNTRRMGDAQQSRTASNRGSGSSTGNDSRTLERIFSDLTDDQSKLLNFLIDINGQDSYDALAAGIGKLKMDEFLVLPEGLRLDNISASEVGKPSAHRNLAVTDWARIYALNKAVAPTGADPATFGLLRLEAVKAGWVKDMREVRMAVAPTDSMQQLANDMQQLRDKAQLIKTAAFLLPMVAEHTFRTMGHHFITSDQANYVARYSDTFRSCLVPEIATLLPAATLYHAALHWVGPGRSREVLMAQLETTQIPDALRIRADAAPAGTAILTTTNAIIEAMASVNLDSAFEKYGNFGLSEIRDMTAIVKSDPCKYHKSYFAYSIVKPNANELAQLNSAKAKAERFAPYAQAFIDTYLRDAALGKARAIKKHADANPVQLRRASTLFRAIARAKVTSVEDLIRAQLATVADDD